MLKPPDPDDPSPSTSYCPPRFRRLLDVRSRSDLVFRNRALSLMRIIDGEDVADGQRAGVGEEHALAIIPERELALLADAEPADSLQRLAVLDIACATGDSFGAWPISVAVWHPASARVQP